MENPPPVPSIPPSANPVPPAPSGTETRNWLIGLHLSGLLGFTAIPFASIIAPLIIWLIKKEGSPEIDEQGKQALNFQISIAIYAIVSGALFFVLIGFLTIAFVFFLWLYGMIKAAVDVNKGVPVRYPLTIPFLK